MRKAIWFALLGACLLTSSCAILNWLFTGDPEQGPKPVPAGLDPSSPAGQAATIAGVIGGPTGLLISQLLTLGNAAWNAYRATPAVQRKRHSKYSSARPKAAPAPSAAS